MKKVTCTHENNRLSYQFCKTFQDMTAVFRARSALSMKSLSIIGCLAIVFASCTSSKKASIITPSNTRTLSALPASSINIPVRIYMKPLFAALDSANSKEFTSEKWPDYFQSSCDFRYKYRFLRSPFTFSCVNNKVLIVFRGYYQIAGSKTVCAFNKQVSPWASGSCGFGQE